MPAGCEPTPCINRDYRAVHDNLSELADLGVVEFEGGGAGKAKKPILVYDGIEFELSFVNAGDGTRSDIATP